MSRRSQAYADGTVKFSWKFEQDDNGRVKCVCKNDPSISGLGDDEASAMRAASANLDIAIKQAKTGSA